VIHKNR
jgi:hypothetical protein